MIIIEEAVTIMVLFLIVYDRHLHQNTTNFFFFGLVYVCVYIY
jgi:hypothetical protein